MNELELEVDLKGLYLKTFNKLDIRLNDTYTAKNG